MEPWLWYACLSALFSGLHAFTLKVAAEKEYSSGYFNALSCTLSAGAACIVAASFVSLQGDWLLGVVLAGLSGLLYIYGANARIDSLRYITSTLYFPISKSAVVILTTLFGVVLFSELLDYWKWIGLGFAITVPLVLLRADELPQQKNFKKGIVFLCIAALLSAVATLVNKYSSHAFESALVFVACTHITIASIGWAIGYRDEARRKEEGKKARVGYSKSFLVLCACAGALQLLGFLTNVMALREGPLSVAYAVMSFQLIVPMLLSVWIYSEAWDNRKTLAVALCIISTYCMK